MFCLQVSQFGSIKWGHVNVFVNNSKSNMIAIFLGSLDLSLEECFIRPSIHCVQAFKKARCAFILKRWSSVTLMPAIFIRLFSTCLCHLLESSIQASSPYLSKDVDRMAHLRRLATRTVKGCRGFSFEQRLKHLNVFSLARRILRSDLILAFNLFHGSLDLPLQ